MDSRWQSEGFDDDQDDDDDQVQERNLVDPAVEHVRAGVRVARRTPSPGARARSGRHQQRHEGQLGVQPPAGEAVAQPQPEARRERKHHAGRHDAAVELALHHLEALAGYGVLGLGVIDEQPREIK